jgi:hypothetical protein
VAFEAKRTQVAQSAFNFSQYFTSAMADVVVQGNPPRRVELLAPEGMSTGGGKQARQAVTLRAEVPGVPALTAGWADVPGRRALLRTHACLRAMHHQRFPERPFEVDPATYQQFFDVARDLLAACGLDVAIENQAVASVAPRPGPAASSATGMPVPTAAAIGLTSFLVGCIVGGLVVYARFVGF